MGILHHILVKDRQHASTIGSLVDLNLRSCSPPQNQNMERPEKGQGYDFEQLQRLFALLIVTKLSGIGTHTC